MPRPADLHVLCLYVLSRSTGLTQCLIFMPTVFLTLQQGTVFQSLELFLVTLYYMMYIFQDWIVNTLDNMHLLKPANASQV